MSQQKDEERLNKHWGLIKREVVVNSIIDQMIGNQIITPAQWKDLKSRSITDTERTEEFLHLLLVSKIPGKFNFFLESLHSGGYSYVAKELSSPVSNNSGTHSSSNDQAMPISGQDIRAMMETMSVFVKEEKELKADMMKEIRLSEQQRADMKKQLEENTNVIKQFDEERENDKAYREKTDHQISLLKGGMEEIKNELQNARDNSDIEEKTLVKEVNKLKKNISSLEAEKRNVEVELKQKMDEIQLLQVRYGIKNNECESRGRTIKEQHHKNTQLANAEEEILILKKQIEAHEKKQAFLQSKVESLELSIITLNKDQDMVMTKMQRSMSKNEEKCKNLEKKLEEKTKEIDLLETCNAKLKNKLYSRQRPAYGKNSRLADKKDFSWS